MPPTMARKWRNTISSPRFAWATILIGLALSWCMATLSDGVYHDDDLTHMHIARWAWQTPRNFLFDWGVAFTALYAAPAALGWLPARLFSGLITALTAWLAYDLARRQRVPFAALVPLLLWIQPMVFVLSYTTLTETTCALLLTLGMWLLVRRHYVLSAAAISLTMLARQEGVVFIGVFGLALLLKRRPVRELLLLVWAPLAHNLLSWVLLGNIPFTDRFLVAKPTEEYGHGGWLWMLMQWPRSASAALLLLAALGAVLYWRRRPDTRLWLACGGTYFLAETVVYRYGLFASGGYARFLTAIAPVVAVSAAEGARLLWAACRSRASSRIASLVLRILALACALLLAAALELPAEFRGWSYWLGFSVGVIVLLACLAAIWRARAADAARRRRFMTGVTAGVGLVLVIQIAAVLQLQPPYRQYAPLRLTEVQISLRDAVEWLRSQSLLDGRQVFSANPWVAQFTGRPVGPVLDSLEKTLADTRPGDLIVWDAKYAGGPARGIPLEELRRHPDLHELASGGHNLEPQYPLFWAIFERLPQDRGRLLPPENPAQSRPGA